jgi:hypothetical protein
MNLPTALRTIRWMVRDTFRQSVATKLFWVMIAATAVATLVCLSASVSGEKRLERLEFEPNVILPEQEAKKIGVEKVRDEGIEIVSGELSFGFGMIKLPLARNREDAVRAVQIWLAAFLADTAGVLLALLWTAGFLPTFLEPQSATVLLAKPAPRWAILTGKYLGVVLFVTLQAALFVAGTWAALGVRTGVWNATYWFAVPLLAINFAVFYSVSAFLAVCTRSTVVAAFGTLLFWMLCWAMNYTYLRLTAVPYEGISPVSQTLLETGYWVLPKPLDMGGIFFDAMRAEGVSAKLPELTAVQKKGLFRPELAVASSLAFAAAVLALAAYEFRQTDY